jgi:hypothetical protein
LARWVTTCLLPPKEVSSVRRLLVASLVLTLGGVSVPQAMADHTAQRGDVPEAACNLGTGTAHEMIPPGSPAHERVPHTHPPSTDCVHLLGHDSG